MSSWYNEDGDNSKNGGPRRKPGGIHLAVPGLAINNRTSALATLATSP